MSTPPTPKRKRGNKEFITQKTIKDGITKLGLYSEHNGQNEEKFFYDMYTKHGTKYPWTACLLIDGVIDIPAIQPQPVPPPGVNAADRRYWEQTVLKLWTSSVERNMDIREDIRKEEVQLCADLKDHCTALLDTRLQTLYPMNNPNGEVWITSHTVVQVKQMMKRAYTGSIAISDDTRKQIAYQQWEAIKMYDNQSFDSFVYFYKQSEQKRNSILGPLGVQQQCHAFLSKLNKSYATVVQKVSGDEAINQIRTQNGQPRVDGLGYPNTLDALIVFIKASTEASQSSTSGIRARSYMTIDAGRGGRGRGSGRDSDRNAGRGRGRNGGRGNQINPSTPRTTNLTSESKPLLTNVLNGLTKTWDDLTKHDNPIEWGYGPCRKCHKNKKVGLHFNHFHDALTG